jgi:NADH pyrophosphatase NudC (nudix superfamily)
MSKITFRADDDLISKLEALDASKSEIMREALRTYLGSEDSSQIHHDKITFDQLVSEHVDNLVTERVNEAVARSEPQDINVNITLDDEGQSLQREESQSAEDRKTCTTVSDNADEEYGQCTQCGETLVDDHVYCPNCGEKANQRVFCECGDEIRSDWSFCPSCGRRTPAADVLDQS